MKKKVLSLAIVLGLTLPCVFACTDNTPHTDMKADFSNTVWQAETDGDPYAKTLRDSQYSDFAESVSQLNSAFGTSFTLDTTCGEVIKYCYDNDKLYWGFYDFIAERPESYTAFKSQMDKRLAAFAPKSDSRIGSQTENKLTYDGTTYSIKSTDEHYAILNLYNARNSLVGTFNLAEECWVDGEYCNKDGYLYKTPRAVVMLNEDNESSDIILDMGYSTYIPLLIKAPDPGSSNAIFVDLRLTGRYYWTLKA